MTNTFCADAAAYVAPRAHLGRGVSALSHPDSRNCWARTAGGPPSCVVRGHHGAPAMHRHDSAACRSRKLSGPTSRCLQLAHATTRATGPLSAARACLDAAGAPPQGPCFHHSVGWSPSSVASTAAASQPSRTASRSATIGRAAHHNCRCAASHGGHRRDAYAPSAPCRRPGSLNHVLPRSVAALSPPTPGCRTRANPRTPAATALVAIANAYRCGRTQNPTPSRTR